ncbi:MAG TPA: DUF721 domain-containing protein [Oscillospiraceae bacterium]|nr:DUF721 domain-containing protein [Oscillospiraceae bacterium]
MIPIAQILKKTLKNLPAAKKIRGQMLIDAWSEVVGEWIAMKTEALAFENGTLLVRVCDSVWAQHLSLQKTQIIAKLQRATKTRVLHDLRFQVGKLQTQAAANNSHPEEGNWRSISLGQQELASIEDSFDGSNLPAELKQSMRALFVAQKKHQKWVIEQGEPSCEHCGLPLVQTARETFCLSCKRK